MLDGDGEHGGEDRGWTRGRHWGRGGTRGNNDGITTSWCKKSTTREIKREGMWGGPQISVAIS